MSNKLLIAGAVALAVLLLLPIAAKYLKPAGGAAPAGAAASAAPAAPGEPRVVSMEPANDAAGVSPQTAALRVTFDRPMGGGFSWTGGGPNMPEGAGKPYWEADAKTCVMPVRLKPNWSYRLGLNSPSHKNFRSREGTPLSRVEWRFSTGG